MKRCLPLALLILAAALLPLLLDPRGYWIRVLTFTLLFAAMAQAWNIVGGLANQISLGHAAFFGIGAYTSTVLLLKFGISPWLGMLAGGALGGVAALVIAIPTMRLQGHYFALATLAFGEVMRVIANVWTSLTGGPGGLSVPFVPPSFAAYSFKLLRPHAYIALAALIVVTVIFEMIRRGAMGYRLARDQAERAGRRSDRDRYDKGETPGRGNFGRADRDAGDALCPDCGILRPGHRVRHRQHFDPDRVDRDHRRRRNRGGAHSRSVLHHPA